jgi:hypothetical protein
MKKNEAWVGNRRRKYESFIFKYGYQRRSHREGCREKRKRVMRFCGEQVQRALKQEHTLKEFAGVYRVERAVGRE